MSKEKTIEIFQTDGSIKDYELFSSRLPRFLEEYPKSEGYCVNIVTSDPLSQKPAQLRLMEAALSSGKNPVDLGLPSIPPADVIIFKAQLIKDGVVLEEASSLINIRNYKDWEKGETAARQRLIAALGFGGECFDKDEESDIQDQNLNTSLSNQSATESTAVEETAVEEAATESTAVEEAVAESTPVEETVAESAPAEEVDVESTPVKEGVVEEFVAVIPDRYIRQIEHLAKLKNIEAPKPKSVQEAKAMLKDLMKA